MRKYQWWSCGSGLVELKIKRDDAAMASHQGQCDDDVWSLSRMPYIAKQLNDLNAEKVAATLREYGAWDATELADHDQNLQRLLWIACGDIVEGNI